MKTIIQLLRQNRIASIVLLLVFVLTIFVVMFDQKSYQNRLQSQTTTGQDTKMDKFKSGTYKPAKEIGY